MATAHSHAHTHTHMNTINNDTLNTLNNTLLLCLSLELQITNGNVTLLLSVLAVPVVHNTRKIKKKNTI